MAPSRLILALCSAIAVAAAACNAPVATAQSAEADPPASSPPGPTSTVSGEPLWRVMLDHGTLVAMNRPPATATPSAPVEADLWIITDVFGHPDTMQIAVTVNCAARTYATRQITSYSGPTVAEDAPAQDTAFYPANADTPYSAMLAHVCDPHAGEAAGPDYANFTEAQAAQRASIR